MRITLLFQGFYWKLKSKKKKHKTQEKLPFEFLSDFYCEIIALHFSWKALSDNYKIVWNNVRRWFYLVMETNLNCRNIEIKLDLTPIDNYFKWSYFINRQTKTIYFDILIDILEKILLQSYFIGHYMFFSWKYYEGWGGERGWSV